MDETSSPYRRALVWGSVAAVLLVGVVITALLVMNREARSEEPPSSVLVVALAEDPDGAVVAGAVMRFESRPSSATVEVIDPMSNVDIAGTTYDRLKDVYAFGGGAAVADAVAQAALGEPSEAWVVLPEDTWTRIVDDAGGATVDVPVAVNAFVDGSLYVIEAGRQRLTGGESAALFTAAAYLESEADARAARTSLAHGIAGVVASRWGAVAEAVGEGSGESSVRRERLQRFGVTADTSR